MRLALWEARLAASQQNYDDAARRYLALSDTLSPDERKKYLDEYAGVLEEVWDWFANFNRAQVF